MESVNPQTPEIILGREPAEMERLAIADGFIPNHRIGDKVEGNHAEGIGIVDAIVLFKVQGGYVWGCRFEGSKDYFPQDNLKKVESPST